MCALTLAALRGLITPAERKFTRFFRALSVRAGKRECGLVG